MDGVIASVIASSSYLATPTAVVPTHPLHTDIVSFYYRPYWGSLNIHSTWASFISHTHLVKWVTGKEILISETNVVFLEGETAGLEAPTQTPLVVFPCCGKEQAQPAAINAWL